MTERLLTARVVAEHLDVSTETVLRWIRRGQLPALRLPGGAIRIGEAQLDAWLAARATCAAPSAPEPVRWSASMIDALGALQNRRRDEPW